MPDTPITTIDTPVTNVTATSSWDGSDVVSIIVPSTGEPDLGSILVFDGVVRLEHRRSVIPAEHPIQYSAPITDHLCVQPFELVMDVIVSDAMQFSTHGTSWSGSFSRSQNCYLTLLGLQGAFLLTISTRLNQYEGMVLIDIRAAEDYKTSSTFKGTLTFRQILTATVVTDSGITPGNSERPLQTDPVPTTTKQTQTPNPSVSGILFGSFGSVSAPAPGH